MKPGDLTTLLNTKLWLSTTNYSPSTPGIDTVLQQLISRWSNAILGELERPWILPRNIENDAYDGDGGTRQFVRNWPINSVSQLAVSGRIIPASPIIPGQLTGNNFGYRLEEWDGIPPGGPQEIELVGTRYYPGHLNVQVSYNAGYLVPEEPWTVPADNYPEDSPTNPSLTVKQPYGIWAQDDGVNYISGGIVGAALTAIPFNPSALPGTAGQYTVIPPDYILSSGPPPVLAAGGQYIFAPGDVDATVVISYGFIPNALEQLAIELLIERFLYRTRVGEITRTVENQVAARYELKEWPDYALPVMQRYRSILPL